MADADELATAVFQRFKNRLSSAFPTKDIHKLFPTDDEGYGLFHFRVEMFLSSVAGYSSRAMRMHGEPEDVLRETKKVLSQSFFEKHPEYEKYKGRITPDATPSLYREMEEAEKGRCDLLKVIGSLLNRES